MAVPVQAGSLPVTGRADVHLVPKLLLGDALGSQVLPGLINFTYRGCTLGAKQSFASIRVPKRELGNQKLGEKILEEERRGTCLLLTAH
jgi:hypothetical protein